MSRRYAVLLPCPRAPYDRSRARPIGEGTLVDKGETYSEVVDDSGRVLAFECPNGDWWSNEVSEFVDLKRVSA